jgi:acetyl esterase/lipase
MKYILGLVFTVTTHSLCSQQVISLYPGQIPNSKGAKNIEKSTTDRQGRVIISNISVPTLSVFLPAKYVASGAAVIICPGGGYWVNAITHEGTDVAKEFVKKGVAAFVLKYRIPDETTMHNTGTGPLQDAQQAMVLVRSRAKEWNIDTAKVGVLGFSAGGHLAASLGTLYNEVVLPAPAPFSLRPAFMILAYPFITGDTLINSKGLLGKLLGANASQDQIKAYSIETRVTPQTPPTFLIHSTDDDLSVKNSLLFYAALLQHKVPVEMHLYQRGGHGYGLNNSTTKDKWLDRCFAWMEGNGWLTKRP